MFRFGRRTYSLFLHDILASTSRGVERSVLLSCIRVMNLTIVCVLLWQFYRVQSFNNVFLLVFVRTCNRSCWSEYLAGFAIDIINGTQHFFEGTVQRIIIATESHAPSPEWMQWFASHVSGVLLSLSFCASCLSIRWL